MESHWSLPTCEARWCRWAGRRQGSWSTLFEGCVSARDRKSTPSTSYLMSNFWTFIGTIGRKSWNGMGTRKQKWKEETGCVIVDDKSAITSSWALINVLNFFLDPWDEMFLMKLMGIWGEIKNMYLFVLEWWWTPQRGECGQHAGKPGEAACRRRWRGLRSCTVTVCTGRSWQPSGTQRSSYSRDRTGAYTCLLGAAA